MAWTLPHLSPACPALPADWRWRRAQLMADPCGDHWNERLAKHLTPIAVSRRDAVLAQAITIYYGDALRRAELEARLLADQPAHTIARRLDVPRSVVLAYTAVFFDVRSRLKATAWIARHALGLRPCDPLERHDVTRLWRLYAYQYGAETLDMLLDNLPRDRLESEGVDAYLLPDVALPAPLKFVITVDRLPIPRNRREFRRLSRTLSFLGPARFRQIEAKTVGTPLSWPPLALSVDSLQASLVIDERELLDFVAVIRESFLRAA